MSHNIAKSATVIPFTFKNHVSFHANFNHLHSWRIHHSQRIITTTLGVSILSYQVQFERPTQFNPIKPAGDFVIWGLVSSGFGGIVVPFALAAEDGAGGLLIAVLAILAGLILFIVGITRIINTVETMAHQIFLDRNNLVQPSNAAGQHNSLPYQGHAWQAPFDGGPAL